MTSPDKSGITVGTRSYTTSWDTIPLTDAPRKAARATSYLKAQGGRPCDRRSSPCAGTRSGKD